MKKNGFTLMELVVYMAMIGIVVLVAGQAFSDSTKFRVRTQNMLRASEEAENVAALFKDDVAQMGAKMSKEYKGSSSTDSFYVADLDLIYMDPSSSVPDSSSFRIGSGATNENTDTLTLRRMRFDGNGHYVSLEEIAWYLDENDSTLWRTCKVIDKKTGVSFSNEDPCAASENPVPVQMASHVAKFYVEPAQPGVSGSLTTQLLPSTDTSVHSFRLISHEIADDWKAVTTSDPSETVAVSGFSANYDFEEKKVDDDGKLASQVFVAQPNSTDGNWKTLCQKVTLEPNVDYKISFDMPYAEDASRMFVPGRDHMAVGFRYVATGDRPAELKDFLFYPPVSANSSGTREMHFTVPTTLENLCMAFTFATYSPVAATGYVYLGNVKLEKEPFSNYEFNDYFTTSDRDKQNVKAFRLHLTINRRGETGSTMLIIPTPSNGPRS
ncbi:MAG: type II secretion system protein [Fibrobacter sp.]|nr:type II secretion system protein [Fibrobacter sp.]